MGKYYIDMEVKNVLHTIKRRRTNWIAYIFHKNCLLRHITESKIEGSTDMIGRRGKRRKELLDDLKKTTGYWKLKEEALFILGGKLNLEEATDML
jgi:hypothetical protein